MPSTASKHPFRYQAFGLTIDSSIELTAFQEATDVRGPIVYITEAEVDPEEWAAYNDYGDRILGKADATMRFKVDRGEEIIFDPLPEADMEFLRAILSGELISVLLRQRGLLALHASAIELDGHAVGFIGGSGYGKSTLATRLVANTGTLLTDDVLAIDLQQPRPTVYPGQQEVKLNSDSSDQLGFGSTSERRAHSFTKKRLYSYDTGPFRGCELRKLYVLEPKKRSANGVVRTSRTDAVLELIRHTRGVGMIKASAFIKAHLQQCETLAKTIPVESLHRTGNLRDLDNLCGVVLEDMLSLRGKDSA